MTNDNNFQSQPHSECILSQMFSEQLGAIAARPYIYNMNTFLYARLVQCGFNPDEIMLQNRLACNVIENESERLDMLIMIELLQEQFLRPFNKAQQTDKNYKVNRNEIYKMLTNLRNIFINDKCGTDLFVFTYPDEVHPWYTELKWHLEDEWDRIQDAWYDVLSFFQR